MLPRTTQSIIFTRDRILVSSSEEPNRSQTAFHHRRGRGGRYGRERDEVQVFTAPLPDPFEVVYYREMEGVSTRSFKAFSNNSDSSNKSGLSSSLGDFSFDQSLLTLQTDNAGDGSLGASGHSERITKERTNHGEIWKGDLINQRHSLEISKGINLSSSKLENESRRRPSRSHEQQREKRDSTETSEGSTLELRTKLAHESREPSSSSEKLLRKVQYNVNQPATNRSVVSQLIKDIRKDIERSARSLAIAVNLQHDLSKVDEFLAETQEGSNASSNGECDESLQYEIQQRISEIIARRRRCENTLLHQQENKTNLSP